MFKNKRLEEIRRKITNNEKNNDNDKGRNFFFFNYLIKFLSYNIVSLKI